MKKYIFIGIAIISILMMIDFYAQKLSIDSLKKNIKDGETAINFFEDGGKLLCTPDFLFSKKYLVSKSNEWKMDECGFISTNTGMCISPHLCMPYKQHISQARAQERGQKQIKF